MNLLSQHHSDSKRSNVPGAIAIHALIVSAIAALHFLAPNAAAAAPPTQAANTKSTAPVAGGSPTVATTGTKGGAQNSAPKVTEKTGAATRALMPLGPGDVVSLQVFGRPELNTTTSIAEDGTLGAPLIGPINVGGLSSTAAAQKVAAAYKSGQFLKNPQVTILVTQSRSQLVSVLGEVRTPGRFAVDSATTVLDLLAQAGGTTERSGNLMYVIRTNSNGEIDRRPIDLRGLHSDQYSLQLLSLQGGDSVFVPPAEQFYIYGQVQAPNMYRLEPDMTVLQAISRSGGLTKVASSNRIEIKRRNASGEMVARKVDMNERIQPDDIIFVKESLF